MRFVAAVGRNWMSSKLPLGTPLDEGCVADFDQDKARPSMLVARMPSNLYSCAYHIIGSPRFAIVQQYVYDSTF